MDNTVNPSHTLRLADALIKQNKDFDMIMLPKSTHGFSDKEDKFFEQKMWRHFAKNSLVTIRLTTMLIYISIWIKTIKI